MVEELNPFEEKWGLTPGAIQRLHPTLGDASSLSPDRVAQMVAQLAQGVLK